MSANKGEAYAKKEWGPDRLFKIIYKENPPVLTHQGTSVHLHLL